MALNSTPITEGTPTYKATGTLNFLHPVTGVPSSITVTIDVSAYDQYGSPLQPEIGDGMFQLLIDHIFAIPPLPGVEETGRVVTGVKTLTSSQQVLPTGQ